MSVWGLILRQKFVGPATQQHLGQLTGNVPNAIHVLTPPWSGISHHFVDSRQDVGSLLTELARNKNTNNSFGRGCLKKCVFLSTAAVHFSHCNPHEMVARSSLPASSFWFVSLTANGMYIRRHKSWRLSASSLSDTRVVKKYLAAHGREREDTRPVIRPRCIQRRIRKCQDLFHFPLFILAMLFCGCSDGQWCRKCVEETEKCFSECWPLNVWDPVWPNSLIAITYKSGRGFNDSTSKKVLNLLETG